MSHAEGGVAKLSFDASRVMARSWGATVCSKSAQSPRTTMTDV